MIVRSIDVNGDWTFGKGKADYKKATKAIAQNVKTRVQSFLGDCFFDRQAGIDWWNLLGSKNVEGLKLVLSTCILNTPGVTGLIELSVNLDNNRTITISYSVSTTYSGTDSDGTVSTTIAYLLTEQGDVLVTEDGNAIQA